jgi:hypothetical protein
METPAPKIPQSSQDTTSALIALARLLGRQAARELAETEQVDLSPPLNKDEGVGNDQP